MTKNKTTIIAMHAQKGEHRKTTKKTNAYKHNYKTHTFITNIIKHIKSNIINNTLTTTI